MNDTNKTILKNASFLMGFQLIPWGLLLALNSFLSRYLGPTAIGQFHLATTFWAFMGMLISLRRYPLPPKRFAWECLIILTATNFLSSEEIYLS